MFVVRFLFLFLFCLFVFGIILYVKCFGRTMLYMCIEYWYNTLCKVFR